MRPFNTSVFPLLALAVYGLGSAFMALPALAVSIPASENPGAYLSREEYDFNVFRQQPYIYQMVTEKDLAVPSQQSSPITIEDGVLPSEHSIQGVLTTPNGQYIIGPEQPQR